MHVLEDRLLGAFGSGVSPKDGVRRPAPDPWRWINASGTPGDTVMMARQRKRALKSTNGRIRIRPIPFARKTQTAVGPQSRLYYGWTDSLRIAAQAPDGTSEAVASVPTEPIPVQEAERDSALTHLDGDMKGMLASALPDTKPAFTDLIVADTGRLWVERPPKKPGTETVPWWVLNPEPKTIHEVQVPSEVDLEVVLNGTAYGTTETEMGAPAVVRYRLNSSS